VSKKIEREEDLVVLRGAMDLAMDVFQKTKQFPKEERYSLTDQMRRSSRSVCAAISEAWRRRRYEKAFLNKLNEAEAEASETRVWIEFSRRCTYLSDAEASELDDKCDRVISQVVLMINDPENWVIEKLPTC
jgi:four helix bundle protein